MKSPDQCSGLLAHANRYVCFPGNPIAQLAILEMAEHTPNIRGGSILLLGEIWGYRSYAQLESCFRIRDQCDKTIMDKYHLSDSWLPIRMCEFRQFCTTRGLPGRDVYECHQHTQKRNPLLQPVFLISRREGFLSGLPTDGGGFNSLGPDHQPLCLVCRPT